MKDLVLDTESVVDQQVRALVDQLRRRVDGFGLEVFERIIADDVHYEESTLVPHDYLFDSCVANLRAILDRLVREPVSDEVAVETGRRKAELGVPLDAILHAYRLGGQVMWQWLSDLSEGEKPQAMLTISADMWRIIDEFSDAAGRGYRAAEGDRARADSQAQERLLGAILDGELQDVTRLWSSVRALSLPERGSFVVLVTSDREQRTELISQLRRISELRSAWRGGPDGWTALLCLPSERPLDREIASALIGYPGRVGVSRLFGCPVDAPAALTEATLAAYARVGEGQPVTRYDEVPMQVLLLREPEAAGDYFRQTLRPVLALPQDERDRLLETAIMWYRCAGSTGKTAEMLHYHRNTVRLRLRRLEELTGFSFTDPAQSAQLYLSLEAYRLNAGESIEVGDDD